MTFSTRGNPRLGQSTTSLTSLGAVGGARGTAAGALRVFVEFLTTYDKKALAQAQSDLASLEAGATQAAHNEEQRQRRLGKIKNDLIEIERVRRGKLNTELRSDLQQIEKLEGSRNKTNRDLAATQRIIFDRTAKGLGLSKSEIELLASKSGLLKEQDTLQKSSAAAAQRTADRTKQQVVTEGQINKIQQSRAQLGPRLAGLAIGAVGGIVGGAILGVGFQLAQTALEKLGDVIQDIVDPGRHAREEIKGLAEEVQKLASAQNISNLQAAQQIVAKFGVRDPSQAGAIAGSLAKATDLQAVNDQLDRYIKLQDIVKNASNLEFTSRQKVKEALLNEARAAGTLTTQYQAVAGAKGTTQSIYFINGIQLEAAVTERLNSLLGINSDAALQAAAAQRELAAAGQLAAYGEQKLADAIQQLVDVQSSKTSAAIDALGTGESSKTKRIQAQIDAASGGGGAGNTAALRNLAEERQIILLRMRLRLMGTAIDLEKYSGKFLLEAINAKINALNKEGAAQARLNSLLDLQYQMSQTIKRNQGESIGDFLERRALEQRHQLQEQQDLQRQNIIAELEDRKAVVEDEVALAENAQRRIDLLNQQGTANRLKGLQKQLKASQDADKKALEAKKKALQDELKAFTDNANKTAKIASESEQQKIQLAIGAIKTIQDLTTISAQIQGTAAAKGFLQAFGAALVASGAMTQDELDAIIRRLNTTLQLYNRKESGVISHGRDPDLSDMRGFARGGYIPLTNARSPFGQNVRFGEDGTEKGMMVINRKISEKMQQAPQQLGPFYMQYSDDPVTAKYRIKTAVKEGIQEALH